MDKYIERTVAPDYYRQQIAELDETTKGKLETLVKAMGAEGSANPILWALSEVRENKAQFARFQFLKEMYEIAMNP